MAAVNASHIVRVPARGLDLSVSLLAGQTFCWEKMPDGRWSGWIGQTPVIAHLQEDLLEIHSSVRIPPEEIRRYFWLSHDWDAIQETFPDDPHLKNAVLLHPGLRCLQDDGWECTANFICSSLKQIPHIIQINRSLRLRFGQKVEGWPTPRFPSFNRLANATEEELRACGLGFRARHLHRAARQMADGVVDWEKILQMETLQATEELLKLEGIGEKVAHCILLYAGRKTDAFPIDVWVSRMLKDYYGKRIQKPRQINLWAKKKFGPACGIAQLFLFHAYRMDHLKKAIPQKKQIAAPKR